MILRTQKREPGTLTLSIPCPQSTLPPSTDCGCPSDTWEPKDRTRERRAEGAAGSRRQTRRAPITEKSASGCKVISASHPGAPSPQCHREAHSLLETQLFGSEHATWQKPELRATEREHPYDSGSKLVLHLNPKCPREHRPSMPQGSGKPPGPQGQCSLLTNCGPQHSCRCAPIKTKRAALWTCPLLHWLSLLPSPLLS